MHFHIADHSSMEAYVTDEFGSGTGHIWLDDLGCTGNESSVFDCSAAEEENCEHYEDIGIACFSTGLQC